MAVSKHKKRVNVTFTKDDIKKIEEKAKEVGLTVTKLINFTLREADII